MRMRREFGAIVFKKLLCVCPVLYYSCMAAGEAEKRSFFATSVLVLVCVVKSDVVLVSSLSQNSLCPHETSATFTCSTSGQDLLWNINGGSIYFSSSSQPGQLVQVRAGHVATLLRHSSGGFFSVLDIEDTLDTSGVTTVECHNGITTQRIEYYHRIADRPTPPTNINITISHFVAEVDHDVNLLNISWTPGNSTESISHYVVQLDNNIPVWVHNTSILLSDQSPEAIHTLRLEAVDMCGQTSKAVMPDMPVMQVLDTTAPTSTTLNKGYNMNGFGIFNLLLLAIYPLLS